MLNLKERHLFPGANTCNGFYSFYNYIIPETEANKIIYLKGGPGTGKSHIIKKVASHFEKKGYTIEYHHSSLDYNSLDALVVKELKISIIDSTSPHSIDPALPDIIDELINLSSALDLEKLNKNKNEIININNEIKKLYHQTYKVLKASESIHESWSSLNYELLDSNLISLLMEELTSIIFKEKYTVKSFGLKRHLFASCLTSQSIISYGDNLAAPLANVYVLKGGPGFCKTDILKFLGMEAQKKGYFVEYFHDAIIPDKLENIIIPELSTGIFTTNEISNVTYYGKEFNMLDYCNLKKLSENRVESEFYMDQFNFLLNKSTNLLSNISKQINILQNFYSDSMNFNITDYIFQDIINKLEKYE